MRSRTTTCRRRQNILNDNETINPELIRQSTAGRVVQIGSGEAAYWAFLLKALPNQAARIREMFRVTHPTALAILRRLVKGGMVIEQSRMPTGNRWFVAERILSIVEQ